MKLNPMQRAFASSGKQMSYGALFIPDFHCPAQLLLDAANEVAQQIPLMRAHLHGDEVVIADQLQMLSGDPGQHLDHPTCFKLSEEDDGYWMSFSHEFLDGWSYSRLTNEIFRVAETGVVGQYKTGGSIGKIHPNEVFNPRLHAFDGIEAQAFTTTVYIDDTYLRNAKARGMRVQDFLAQAVCVALDNPNVITSTIIKGFEDHYGHYSLYGSGSMKDDRFSLDCSHENFTRLMIARGLSETNGNCFVGSSPIGRTNYETPKIFQMLKKNQMGRVQAVSMNGLHRVRVALNQAIEHPEQVVETLIEALTT